MASALAEQIGVVETHPREFLSKTFPVKMGNSMPIAYGGCTVAVAVSAACSTVPPSFSPYSIFGHFHGPASTEQKLYCSVEDIRNTRTFATRRVQVKQKQPNGNFRTCLELLADFHTPEPLILQYSAPPTATWPKPDDCPSVAGHVEALRVRGEVTLAQVTEFTRAMGAHLDFFETRACLNGVASQNLSGTAKEIITTQENLPISSKTYAEWQRAKNTLQLPTENFAALAFLMDGALSFVPLTHNHLWFDDVAACSTLDFALRIFAPSVKMENWHLKERSTSRAGSGRTYSEGRLWDVEGNLVASMTQQSILRVKDADAQSNL
ncbi:thioesterase-like superfamily-domain-containing protein [Annulohypoxylon bovei var. microspora]|nr:thioesterase-like superfamily-domain-containing protein [Annulohypoxylon bovei var. microspora]